MPLGPHRYGKAGIHLAKVERDGPEHRLVDLELDVTLEGGLDASYLDGDNTGVLPTDTLRGTCYAFAREGPVGPPEAFALRLARHFVATVPTVDAAEVAVRACGWKPIAIDGTPHPHAFTRAAGGVRLARARAEARATTVEGGIDELAVRKTAGSAFTGFLRDRYTTLADAEDRILATTVRAIWRFAAPAALAGPTGVAGAPALATAPDFDACHAAAASALLGAFARHDDSQSVQHSLWVMGQAALDACPQVISISLTLPNRHHVLADLTPYGQDNPGEVFVVLDRPRGVIEGTVQR